MARYHLTQLESVDVLRKTACAWDTLWQRSEVTTPTARAEMLALWLEQFAAGSRFRALVVWEGKRIVAALPLIGQRLGGVVDAAALPTNAWSPGGDLLLDLDADADAAMDLIAAKLFTSDSALAWLEAARLDRRSWQSLLRAADRAQLGVDYRPGFEAAVIPVPADWDTYQRSWSKGHRKSMRRAVQRLERDGGCELELHRNITFGQAELLLQEGFAIEDRSWKGRDGTSVMRNDGMVEFFLRQGRQLAEWGQLELAFLRHAGRRIAFEYAFRAKGVYHSLKVGYDEQFARCSPGQVLTCLLLQRMVGDPRRQAMDCMGPINDATRKWTDQSYTIGRLVIAPRRLLGRTLMHVYKRWWPAVRRLARRGEPLQPTTPSATTASAEGTGRETS